MKVQTTKLSAVVGSGQVSSLASRLEGACVWKDERPDIVLFTQ